MQHLTEKEFFQVFDVSSMKLRNQKFYKRIYNRVRKEWESPEDWYKSDNKIIKLESRNTNCYWIVWGLINLIPLPLDFINSIRPRQSELILKKLLKDYDLLLKARSTMLEIFAGDYFNSVYSIIIKMCLYKGIDSIENITIKDISDAGEDEILVHDGYRTKVANLLYYMEYTDKVYKNYELHYKLKSTKMSISEFWSSEMIHNIQRFISNLYNARISSKKVEVEKISSLNTFIEWYVEKSNTNIPIQNLLFLDRELWIEYVKYINSLPNITSKTKSTKLLAVKDLYNWAQIKMPELVLREEVIKDNDFSSYKYQHKRKNLAFEKREYGERILSYLIDEFVPKSIEDKFRKEAIIVTANSGLRISELRNLEYGSCFYSEDEGLYKVIIEYNDKVNIINRPIYITQDGYEAIKRVEELKRKNDVLKDKYNNRVNKSFVHLFDYRGSDTLARTNLYKFIKRIKKGANLVDVEGKVILGGMHAWRHFFGMTLFIESNYNISVVRYLLGHKDYRMSFQYLEEEKNKIFNKIRCNDDSNVTKFSGKGLNTIIEILIADKKSEYTKIKKVLDQVSDVNELIEFKHLKKVSFGYCLKECDKRTCLRCKNFILSNDDSIEILNALQELFEIVCFRVSLYLSFEEAIKDLSIQSRIADFKVLCEEVKNLEIDYTRLPIELKSVIDHEE